MTYAELVATAAVGTAQRPVPELPPGLVPDADAERTPAERLLDAAAAYAVARRANLLVTSSVAAPAGSEPDELEVPPERFIAALARQIGQITDDQRTLPLSTVIDLVVEALAWMGQVGWRLPERLLVPVLQRAGRDARIAQAATGALGERGRWLVALNPVWARAFTTGDDTAGGAIDDSAWQDGTPAVRLAHLASLRQRDPGSARALLEQTWSTEAVDDRVAFIELVVATAVSSDEELLQRALSDRSSRVAAAARVGLLRIPRSALLGRLRERAARAVAVQRGLLSRTVRLTPPDDDAAASADGLNAGTYSRTPAENRLNALVASIPPQEWPALVGVQAQELLRATAGESWSVAPGLAEAAVRWGDRDLATALVEAGLRSPDLLALVDDHRIARLLEDPSTQTSAASVNQLVAAWPRPWPPLLAGALGQWLQLQLTSKQTTAAIPGDVIAAAATALPVQLARGWSHRLRDLSTDQRVGYGLQRAARNSAAALTLRAAMYDDVRAALDRSRGGPPSNHDYQHQHEHEQENR